MDKQFLLLRNNQQKGPFTLEELVQQGLKPSDLIWIEGLSSVWAYPYEIHLLKPYLSTDKIDNHKILNSKEEKNNPATSHPFLINKDSGPVRKDAKHIYVSLPNRFNLSQESTNQPTVAINLEQKAEELKKKVEMYVAGQPHETALQEPPAYHPRSINDLKKEYTLWQHKQQKVKKRKHFKKNSLLTLITILIVGVGYVLAKDTILTKRVTTEETITNKLHSEAGKTAKRKHQRTEAMKEVETYPSVVDYNVPDSGKTALKTENWSGKRASRTPRAIAVKIPVPTIAEVEKDIQTPILPIAKDSAGEQNHTIQNSSFIEKEAKSDHTLGSKISSFFNKFRHKKQDEKTPDKTGIPNSFSKAEITVFPYSNAAKNEHGLKITLQNPNEQVIKKAIVEVQYFDTANNLLDKRLLHFANIGSKSSSTLIVPDQPLTDHTSYQLLSVEN